MKVSRAILLGLVTLLACPSLFAQTLSKHQKKDGFWAKHVSLPGTAGRVGATDYYFSQSTGTYSDLTGSISVNNNDVWDDPEYVIPIGFSFELFDLEIDSLYMGIGLGGLVSSNINLLYEAEYLIMPFEADLIDRGDLTGISQSPISYKLEGSPGSRIFKLEWKNAGFYNEGWQNGTLNDYVNFQLWLYEGSNDIEFHMGSNQVTDPTLNYDGGIGPLVGVADYDGTKIYLLMGNPSSPTVTNSAAFLAGEPPNGTIYKFSKTGTGINAAGLGNMPVTAYPNPFSQEVRFTFGQVGQHTVDLVITDVMGRSVQEIRDIRSTEVTISRSELTSGMYFYTVLDEGRVMATGKLVVE